MSARLPLPASREILAREARRVKALRMQLLEAHPFWGYLLLQVKLVAAPELDAFAATDCLRHIWYNPYLTRHLDERELGFVLAHEVGHQVTESAPRRGRRNRRLWNCATDYAINRLVHAIRTPGTGERLYRAPHGSIPGLGLVRILYEPRFERLIAEAIYEQLAADALPEPRSMTVVLRAAAGGTGTESIRIPGVIDHGGGLDVHLPVDLTPAERSDLRRRISAAVRSWERSGSIGALPGGLLRSLELSRPGKVPWRRLLRRLAGLATARDDYTLSPPNKRYLDHDVVVPGLWSARLSRVVVAVDTSGSMSRRELELVGAEIRRIAEEVDEVFLLAGDTEVREAVPPAELERFLRSVRFRGGGGTSHRPFFEWIRTRAIHPDLFIGLTDLQSFFPERPPQFPVIWVVPPRHGRAPWGHVVTVNQDQELR